MNFDSSASSHAVSRRQFGLLAGGAIAGTLPFSGFLGCDFPSQTDLPLQNPVSQMGPVSQADPPSQADPISASNCFVEANNELAFAMFKLLATKTSDKNLFFSPFSIQSAVLMEMEGARSETAEEMGNAISLPAKLKSEAPALPWNLSLLNSDLKKLTAKLHKMEESKARSTRMKISELRKQLEESNARIQALVGYTDSKELKVAAAQANKIADQINSLASQVDQFQLNVANSVWVDQSLAIRSEFAQTLEANYGTGRAVSVDFKTNPEEQCIRINQWVADQTNQMILDLITKEDIVSETAMVLVNAISFLGTWSSPFEPSETTEAKFRNGKNLSLVSMMSKYYERGGRYGAFKSDGTLFETPELMPFDFPEEPTGFGYPETGYQVVELPYNGNSLSMLIIVPMEDDGFAKITELLTSEMLAQWTEVMKGRRFQLMLPRFKIECSNDLKAPMIDLGMKRAFNDGQADFSGMTQSQNRLFISMIVHKAVIDVNEEGTKAAAASSIVISPVSAGLPAFIPDVVADHPFLFLIRNPETGAILFMGQFTNSDR